MFQRIWVENQKDGIVSELTNCLLLLPLFHFHFHFYMCTYIFLAYRERESVLLLFFPPKNVKSVVNFEPPLQWKQMLSSNSTSKQILITIKQTARDTDRSFFLLIYSGEHLWPRSYGLIHTPSLTDLHNIRPADVNGTRINPALLIKESIWTNLIFL